MRGFTLIEVLMYMGLYAVFACALASCVMSLQNSSLYTETKATAVEAKLIEWALVNRTVHYGRE